MSERILVIKHGALGDIVLAFAPMEAIRAHHRSARITILTTVRFADLLERSPYGDEVWIDPRKPLWRLDALLALRGRLRGANFKRVYDLQTSSRSSLIFDLMGPGARPQWSGIAKGCSHPHADPQRDAMHTLERQAGQLAVAGVEPGRWPPDIDWLDEAIDLPPQPFALIVPGGSAARRAKRWPAQRFAEVATRLESDGVTPVVLGIASEATLAAAVVADCRKAVNLAGATSIAQVARLGRYANFALGNDTGTMHLLAASGTATLTLFSSESDPELCAPRGPEAPWLRRTTLDQLPVDAVMAAFAGWSKRLGPSRQRS